MIENLSSRSGEGAQAPSSDGPDLARLNEAEREALFLLAEGHTAKSIAALTGRSVAAVNERLREARRKTGISSSRELARLLKAQKNRDEEMGMDDAPAAEPFTRIEAAPTRPRGIGRWIVMSSFVIAAVAAAAIFTQGAGQNSEAPSQAAPNERPDEADALLAGAFRPPGYELGRLYERVRSEAREPTWADRAEQALGGRYSHLLSSGSLRNVRATCASTICELAGQMVGKSGNDINATMQDIQDDERDKVLNDIGLSREAAAFGTAPASDQPVFVTYWLRSAQ